MDQEKVLKIIEILNETYPMAGCALDYDTRFHLLCAVVLSAQTTDVSVNKVTPALFEKYDTAEEMAHADVREVENIIRQIGLYRNKASNLIKLSKVLADEFGGEVPGNYDDLVSLPGVGRKTANVVLAEGFGEQRIAVDTHVFRVSNRIGLAEADDVLHTEEMLMETLPHDRWTLCHHLLILHGRNICKARKPECEACPVAQYCKFYLNK